MNFEDRYNTLDRILYRIAFNVGTAQHALSDVEEMIFNDKLEDITVDDPVFITSLPRSGTTILLRLLWQTGEFASHTYQDMPFVLCPLFWNQYSSYFSADTGSKERTHGDGIEISGDSPEEFEEMVWKYFWSEHYGKDKIRPWENGENNSEFIKFFRSHMRKIIALRSEDLPSRTRYLSKNNLNIARLPDPPEPLNQGTFLIPFREPKQQAASMLNQHERLLDIQAEDSFVSEYMEAIGHHEFGETLKPVNFGDWLNNAAEPKKLTFWVQYWVAAYQFILEHAGDTAVFISYHRLVEKPEESLANIEELLDISEGNLSSQADQLRAPRTHQIAQKNLPDDLLQEASSIYKELDKIAEV